MFIQQIKLQIDGWSFFCYLQTKGIPKLFQLASKHVIKLAKYGINEI